MAKIALYTVNTGEYDEIKPLNARMFPGIDCYMVTDSNVELQGWKKILVTPDADPHRQQRYYKIMYHKIAELKGYDTVIYVDANIDVIRPITALIQQFKGGLLTSIHPKRDCVYHEGWACIDLHKAAKEVVLAQLSDYAARGIRPGSGMYQTGFIIRDQSPETHSFCKLWHQELDKHSHRDQLSIIPARDELGFKISTFPAQTFRTYFRTTPHRNRQKPVIHYLTPYDSGKNIGKAYNEAIERIGDDNDWIVVRDGDTLFPTPQWGKHIEDTLMKVGDHYQLIGAMTNRIGGEHQRVPGMFEVWDMREHVKKAQELQEKHYAAVEETNKGVAGFFLAFRKKTWKQIKFTENPNEARLFDTVFYKAVRAAKMRVGIMKGLYIVHLYRPLSDSPRTDVKHLV